MPTYSAQSILSQLYLLLCLFWLCVAAVIGAQTLTALTPLLQWTWVQKLTLVLWNIDVCAFAIEMKVFIFVPNGRHVTLACACATAWIAGRTGEESISHGRIKETKSKTGHRGHSAHRLSWWAANLVTNVSRYAIAQTIFLTGTCSRGYSNSLNFFMTSHLSLSGSSHQYPSLGMQLFINNSNVINNSCKVFHLCLCHLSVTLDCTIKKTHWRVPLRTPVHRLRVVCDGLCEITTSDNETHNTRWVHVVSIINLAPGLASPAPTPAWSKLGSYQSPTHFPPAMTDLQGHWRATGSCLLWSWSTFACAAELGRRGMTVITFRCIQLS